MFSGNEQNAFLSPFITPRLRYFISDPNRKNPVVREIAHSFSLTRNSAFIQVDSKFLSRMRQLYGRPAIRPSVARTVKLVLQHAWADYPHVQLGNRLLCVGLSNSAYAFDSDSIFLRFEEESSKVARLRASVGKWMQHKRRTKGCENFWSLFFTAVTGLCPVVKVRGPGGSAPLLPFEPPCNSMRPPDWIYKVLFYA